MRARAKSPRCRASPGRAFPRAAGTAPGVLVRILDRRVNLAEHVAIGVALVARGVCRRGAGPLVAAVTAAEAIIDASAQDVVLNLRVGDDGAAAEQGRDWRVGSEIVGLDVEILELCGPVRPSDCGLDPTADRPSESRIR